MSQLDDAEKLNARLNKLPKDELFALGISLCAILRAQMLSGQKLTDEELQILRKFESE
jgi:hypothetical protein